MEVVILVIGLVGTGVAVTLAKREERKRERALVECFSECPSPLPRRRPER